MAVKRKKWVQEVKTVSTFPHPETFNQDAESIAKTMARKEVSPKGLGSAVRMVQYFINRSGKTLSASRKKELEKAKRLLQEKAAEEKGNGKPRAKRPTTKKALKKKK